MKLLEFIPIKLSFLLITGVLLGYLLEPQPWVLITLLIGSLTALAFTFNKKRTNTMVFGSAMFVAFMSIGMLSIVMSMPKNLPGHYQKRATQTPSYWHFKIREQLKPNKYSFKYIAKLIAIDCVKVQGKLLINQRIHPQTKRLEVDDEVIFFGRASEIPTPLNPYQFNYRSYMEGLGVYHQIRLDSTRAMVLSRKSKTVFGIAAKIRATVISKLKKSGFGPEELSIITALLLGERSTISSEVYSDYKNAGALHILAISGLHIGILMMLFQYVLKPLEFLPGGRNVKLGMLVLFLWGFAFLAGLSTSVIRAVTMFSFVAYALYLNRPSNTFNVLALSLFFMLLIFSPALLFQIGFQMSYAAVLAIVAIYPFLMRLWFPKNIVIRKLWQLLAVSLAAQFGVLPISLYYFHQFPGLFFVSNLLIVPFLGLILGMGLVIIILGVLDCIPDWLVWTYNTAIRTMNEVMGLVADQKAFIFTNISFDEVQLVLSYLIVFSLLFILKKPVFKSFVILLILIIGMELWSLKLLFETHKTRRVVLLHQTKNTIILEQHGQKLSIYSNRPSVATKLQDDYVTAERIERLSNFPLMHSFYVNSRLVFLLDSLGIYPPKDLQIDIVILTQSPKINLDRFLDIVQPKKIIADGSNYRSFVKRWEQSCAKRKLPFHYTGEKGAYFFIENKD